MSVFVNLAPVPKLQFSQNGIPLAGGQLFTYLAGTSTPQPTYSNSSGTATNTNPIILDANGQCDCWLVGGIAYKFILAPATDTNPPSNPYWTEDNIKGINDIASSYAKDTGVANAYAVALNPAPTAYQDGLQVVFDAANTNTGASTLNVNGLGAIQITNAGAALTANTILAGSRYVVSYQASTNSFLILERSNANSIYALVAGSTSQTFSVAPATSGSAQAPQIAQIVGAGGGEPPNISSTRALFTTYTNSTNRPIIVEVYISVTINTASAAGLYADRNGVAVASNNITNSSSSSISATPSLFFIVPPGVQYSVAYSVLFGTITGTPTINSWKEY